MTPRGSRPHCSPCQNLSSTKPVKDKLAKDLCLVESPHLDSISPALSLHPPPGPNLVLILNPAPAPTPAPNNELFEKFMKTDLETNQGSKQPPAERKQLLKAKVPEVYYGKSHIDCYHFCHQYKDYFEAAGDTRANQTPFTAFFFCGNISVCWT